MPPDDERPWSCPTCGRSGWDGVPVDWGEAAKPPSDAEKKLDERLAGLERRVTVVECLTSTRVDKRPASADLIDNPNLPQPTQTKTSMRAQLTELEEHLINKLKRQAAG